MISSLPSRLHPVCIVTLGLLTFFLHCALPSSLGQPSPRNPLPAKLRFLFLDETPGAYVIKTGGTYRQISSSPYAISPVFTPDDTLPLAIYKNNPAPDPLTGKIIRTKVATVTPPTNTTSSLVVVTPAPAIPSDSTEPPSYAVTFFDSDPRSFPAKSIRILNLGHTPMAAQFGTTRVVTLPGASNIVQPATDGRNRVFAQIAVQDASGWKLLYDNITILRPDDRLTGVFLYSPSGLLYSYTPVELAEFGKPPPGHFWLTFSDSP